MFALYLVNTDFEGSGHDRSLAFYTLSLGCKSVMDYWKYLLNMLVYSRDPFRSSRVFMLRGLY